MKTRYKLADFCFYIFWFLLQLGKGMGYTSQDGTFKLLLVCAIPFAMVRMLFTRWDKKSFIYCVALNMLGVATMIASKSTTYLLSIFCITAVKGMDLNKLLKTTLFIRGPLFVLRTSLAILGFTDMQLAYRFVGGEIITTRYALGYVNPNTTQFELFMLLMLAFYLYSERINLFTCLLGFAYSLLLFQYTNSKTAYYLSVPFILCAFICKRQNAKLIKKLATEISSKSWIFGIFFTFVGCFIYMNVYAFQFLGTFASRFLTASRVIQNYQPTLFGNQGVKTDLGYIFILYDGGIILATLFFAGINKLMKTKFLRSDVLLCIAFACLSVFNIMETYTYSVLSNPLLLYLSCVVYPGKSYHDNEQSYLPNRVITHNTP